MNERVAQVGEQVKQAFGKVVDAWKALEASRKRLIVIIAIGLVVFAIGLMVVLSISNNRFVELYKEMSPDETTRALSVLETAGTTARINESGNLEVPKKQLNLAMGQLAQQGIPSNTLDYSIFQQATGLTTTEFEKKQYRVLQLQNRMQDIIKTFDGIQDAHVTLEINTESTRAWDTSRTKDTGSVALRLSPGQTLDSGQIQGIRFLVGSSVGIDPADISIVDSSGTLLAAAGKEVSNSSSEGDILHRLGVAEIVEENLRQKADNVMSLIYPDQSRYRITPTVEMDWDSMKTEIMEYFPLEGTNHGVLDDEELEALLTLGQYAEGVVGETDNTDVPVYLDRDGDGEPDDVNIARFRDYAVSYTLKQIDKDGPSRSWSSIAISIDGILDTQTRTDIRDQIHHATGVPVENIGVNAFPVEIVPPVEVLPWYQVLAERFNIPPMAIFIAFAALLGLILILILVAVLRHKAKKKRLAAELAAAEAEKEEAERIQQEIEERKQQLKNAAIGDQSENAITNEVRDFARHNPEITATLLRNWLKEDM